MVRGKFPALAIAAIFLGAVRPTFVLNRRSRGESFKIARATSGDAQAFLSTGGPGRSWSRRCDRRGTSSAIEVVQCVGRSTSTCCMFVQEPVFADYSPDSRDSVLLFSNAVAASKAQTFRTRAFAMLDTS